MGGMSLVEDFDWVEEVDSAPTTVVLMGRTGNGKSATGNSILGKDAFQSRRRACSVTTTCELESTKRDGRVIRVVDTPGFFEVSMPTKSVRDEIVKCLELAKDGVHALLLVLSVNNRFTMEEMNVVENLRCLFGDKVMQYMIVVFTGGDSLERDKTTLEEYCDDSPQHLKSLLNDCGGRKILFNNTTQDNRQKEEQATALLRAVDEMVLRNGGKPYTNELLGEARTLAKQSAHDKRQLDAVADRRQEMQLLKLELEQAYDEKVKAMEVMVDEKLRLTAEMLEERLAAEQRAREISERQALEYKELSERQAADSAQSIKELKKKLEMALKQSEELRKEREAGFCAIL